MIRSIEELSMNAWPAMQTLHYDGWVLRYSDGYTKRANSVYPLYPSEINLDEKIEFCESFYHDRGLPAVFKLTEASTPANLDARLAERGYRKDSPTSVQTLDLRVEVSLQLSGLQFNIRCAQIFFQTVHFRCTGNRNDPWFPG